LNGVYVAAEFAINGVRPTQVEELSEGGNRTAQLVVDTLNSTPKQSMYIATSQLGITLASLGLGMYGEPQISHFIEPFLARLLGAEPEAAIVNTVGYIVALSLLTYLHVVLGEIVPKTIVLNNPAAAALVLAKPMRLTEFIFSVPVRALNGLGNGLLRLMNLPPGSGRLHSTEELEQIVTESAEGGLLNEDEEDLILNIFTFGERQVHQVMTPRPRIEALEINTPLDVLIETITSSQYSRFPVYEEDLDHIIGILHLKDVIRQQMQNTPFNLKFLLRPAPSVPEHYPAAQLLNAFKRRRLHMAIVLDEFGGTAGIVTLEDLVEEIIGEVRDEFDKKEEDPLIELSPGSLEVSGQYLLEDLEDYVHIGTPADLPDVETVGGLIITALGRPPQVGDKLTLNDINFTVISIDGLAVERVRIDFHPPQTDSPE
ncbi:MAG TPA: HlyC/CorC family transporter, partial [Anaerolineae bacterium]|nr:HlyC/CorC family transporter [Anaerolineae bacterium]